jgi:branched-chain amino acid transport system permease protein
VTWISAAVLVVGGAFVARLSWRRIADAWDRAATVARDRGYLA